MNKIEAVIFDWAGTTVDYGCFAPVQAFIEVFRVKGIEPTIEETREPMGMLKRDHIKRMLSMSRIQQIFYETYKRDVTEDDIDEMHEDFETRLMSILHQFAEPKPFVIETIEKLRERQIKIGSTTGYTDKMMEIVTGEAKKRGYSPDCWYSPDATNQIGRPYPYMIFQNMEKLKVTSVHHVIKVGDTVSDILEGKNAGVITVGIIEGSSIMGYTQEEYKACSADKKEKEIERVKKCYKEVGADYIIKDMSEFINILERIERNERKIESLSY